MIVNNELYDGQQRINALYQNCDFIECVKDAFKRFISHSRTIHWSDELDKQIEKSCRELYPALTKLKEYKILAHIITADQSDKKYLELFFNRINTGGTPITQEELKN